MSAPNSRNSRSCPIGWRFGLSSIKWFRRLPVTGSNHIPCNCNRNFSKSMSNLPSPSADRRARFAVLAEYPNISTGRQFAARHRSILTQPIISAEHQPRQSRSHALQIRTWFRIIATLASGKRITLRRRSANAYSHVALYARPGVDNEPEAIYGG
jgi:hypothetical protein